LLSQVSGRISGIRALPDIRYPAFGLAGYPAKTVSGASLKVMKLFQIVSGCGLFENLTFCQLSIVRRRQVRKYFSGNKKRFVWSLSCLPPILGQQYAAQLRALDMAV
jgi:hypothetical protein